MNAALGLGRQNAFRLAGNRPDMGTTMVTIEQNRERGLALADGLFVMERGSIAPGGAPSELRGDSRLEALYLGEAEDQPATVG